MCQKKLTGVNGIDLSKIDKGIVDAVILLNQHGFKTFESCESGEGHSAELPMVRFEGSDFDLLRAYEVCQFSGMNVYEARRIYRKVDIYENTTSLGIGWDKPLNEIVFIKHELTGTIYRPSSV